MEYSKGNLNEIHQHVLKLGMLSPPEDVVALSLLFKSLPKVNNFLELGSYIGGGLGIFNEMLIEASHNNVNFTGVDHLDFIGATTTGAWYTDHFKKCLTEDEVTALSNITTANEATTWIQDRTQRLTNKSIALTSLKSESELDSTQYDIIHHDYGDSVNDNLATIRNCVTKLKHDGIYIVDDWCTGAPFRTWATVLAQQEGLLFPIMWGKNKVCFAKNRRTAQLTVDQILANPTCDRKLFKYMPGSDFFGERYRTIRMHWQAMQWS
ncbi:hypothetical protein UFOVP71_109 [uncultured Caudovirales phage]|uniref:Methyltransferase domain containing protein n=1 Tax=uncultured Caudovirales phage TaxID=2100421 RepID=A0A6J5TAE1_9CAUD|nr:hypothetical protein UFOVP71_109 [uncultured Caudovirales phage]